MRTDKFYLCYTGFVKRWLIILLGVAVVVVLADLYGPWKADARNFDVQETARLETEMWRAYYNKQPLEVARHCVQLLRQQGFTPTRAVVTAGYAARAAQTFKVGRGRADYVKAIPALTSYFREITRAAALPGNPKTLAALELDWWVIHRERGWPGEPALARKIAETSAELYGVEIEKLMPYAEARARAMLERSDWGAKRPLTEEEWNKIRGRLVVSYANLSRVVRR